MHSKRLEPLLKKNNWGKIAWPKLLIGHNIESWFSEV